MAGPAIIVSNHLQTKCSLSPSPSEIVIKNFTQINKDLPEREAADVMAKSLTLFILSKA